MTLHVAVVNRHPSDTIGGSELQCDLFARGLVASGHEVTYLALDAAAPEGPVAALPYRLVHLDAGTSWDARAVVDAVRDAEVDAVYWRHGRRHLDGVARGLAAVGIPLVLAVAHVDDVSRWPTGPRVAGGPRDRLSDLRHRLAHRRSWRAFRDVAAIAAQRADFVGLAPVAVQRHIPNVVDPTTVAFAWPRPYVAWVANLKPRKRPELLVPLAHALALQGVDLLVVGGLQDRRYRALMSPDPSVPNLHPLGLLPADHAAGVIAGARCLAVTARPEGLSNAMIQAWWHGVPTVSLDYDPDRSIVSEGLGTVSGGDRATFLADVVRFAGEDVEARAAGGRAAAFARRRFALDDNVSLLATLLADVSRRDGGRQGSR